MMDLKFGLKKTEEFISLPAVVFLYFEGLGGKYLLTVMGFSDML